MSAASGHSTELDAFLEVVEERTGQPVTYAEAPQPFTGGRDTQVYALRLTGAAPPLDQRLVLRVFRPGQAGRARFEAETHRCVAALGYPVPLVLMDGLLGERPFVLMPRVPGRPATDFILPPTRLAPRIPGLLAEAHAALHALDVAPVREALTALATKAPRPEDELARRLDHVRAVGDRRFDALDGWLVANALDEGVDVICHGDFHPLNVLVDGDHVSGVIDWPGVQIAPAEFDVARTLVILRDAPFSVPAWLRPFAVTVRRLIASRYLAAYRRLRPVDDARLRYSTALACTMMLLEAAEAALDRRGHAWRDPAGALRLAARLRRITGIEVSDLAADLAVDRMEAS
jgi:aminoglycoside phosphotransferase (APT) family kinase protein